LRGPQGSKARQPLKPRGLPGGQTILTTATEAPPGVEAELVLRIDDGVITTG
jgi:hypothetical protein